MAQIDKPTFGDYSHNLPRLALDDFTSQAMQEVLGHWDRFRDSGHSTKSKVSEQYQHLSLADKSNLVRAATTAFANTMEKQGEEVARGVRDGCKNVAVGVRSMANTAVELVSHPQKGIAAAEQSVLLGAESADRLTKYVIAAEQGKVQPINDATQLLQRSARRWDNLSTYEKATTGTEALLSMLPIEGLMAGAGLVRISRSENLAEMAAKFDALFARMDKTAARYETLSGAGGEWRVVNERRSLDVVQQFHPYTCVAAVGEMLSEGRLDQRTLANEFKKYWPPEMQTDHRRADIKWLAKELGADWKSGAVSTKDLDVLLNDGRSFCADFREPGHPGHAVVIDGLDQKGNIRIRDPWQGTRYEMTRADFLAAWKGQRVAFRI